MSNAKRFGGAHSPGGPKTRFSGKKASSFSWRVLGLYAASAPLVIPGLGGLLAANIGAAMATLPSWLALILAAWLTAEGLKAEAAYEERAVAKPPAFPRKIAAAGLTGLALFAVMLLRVDTGLIQSIIFGALAAGAHIAAFGLDPMKAKGVVGVDDAELNLVAEKIDQAEAVVNATVKAAERLKDRALEDRVDALTYAARDILREIQSDPRDLRRSRKFLSVHLVGLRDATLKLANARAKGAEGALAGEYAALLADLEQSFAKHRETLLIDDKVDLEVEIEVLRDRLKQEGAL